MNCPIKDRCENYTPVCQLHCKEYDLYQRREIDRIVKLWKKAHPNAGTIMTAILIAYLAISFACVLYCISELL